MGHKKVCFECRKAYSIYNNDVTAVNLTCPECGNQTVLISHRFRPPKRDNIKQWTLSKFMIDNGFHYQHIQENNQYVRYPTTMEEAETFVIKYKGQRYLP